MTIWVDAHISPGVAAWINENFPYEAHSLRGMGLRDAKDAEIFEAARKANAIIISKDSDFLDLIGKFGSPPKLIYLRCGNTTINDSKKSSVCTFKMPYSNSPMEKL